ncbi:DoxX family protein [Candidatus Micrarchaeota archaeon]|nr:DoxX family protein [Candidatus Micrarchaeota archaeon]
MKKSAGLLLMRLALGLFMIHGYSKLTDINGTTAFFSSLGVPMPGIMAYVVGLTEFLGGLAMILGIFTSIAGVLLGSVMLVAFSSNFSGGLISYELDLVFLMLALGIGLIGPGKFSLKALIKNKCNCGGNCPVCKL